MFGGQRQLLSTEGSKPADVGSTLSRLGRYFKPYRLVVLAVALLIIGSTWAQVQAPELIGQAVDCYLTPAVAGQFKSPAIGGSQGVASAASTNCWYTAPNPQATQAETIQGLGGLILIVVALFVGSAIMSGLQFYLMTWAGQRILKNLRVELFTHLNRLSLKYYSENQAGNVMSRITNDMETIQQAVNFALVNVTSGALLIVWIAYKMLTLSVPYALISMAVVPLMIVVTIYISGQARKAFRRTRQEIGKVNAGLQESISGVREVQAFGREDANIETFRETNAANRDANIRAVAFSAAMAPTLDALNFLAVALVSVTGGLALLRGQDLLGTTISLGLVAAYLGYVQRFNQPIQQISVLWTNIQSAVAGAERIFGLLDTPPEVQDAPDARPMPEIAGKVEFNHVDAAYKPGIPVLKDVSFTAEPGQMVAIVGITGAGKTTIINLIPRFYDVVSGEICIDGIDISKVQLASLRKQIGIVLQDTFLFSDTVMNNIRFGKPEATDDQVKAAAALAHADDFIQRLSEGYNTVLGEHGSGLSQGQRQLIAIARAALTDPRILILDEATSSVDTRTERQIQNALEVLLKGRTSFVIAHRLSTIRNADQVLVIENGEIVERGRHADLLARRGAYYRLYMRQFGREEPVSENGRQTEGLPSLAKGEA